jgi:hypothetical protein
MAWSGSGERPEQRWDGLGTMAELPEVVAVGTRRENGGTRRGGRIRPEREWRARGEWAAPGRSAMLSYYQ